MKLFKLAASWLFTIAILFGMGYFFYWLYLIDDSILLTAIIAIYVVNLLFISIIFVQERHMTGKLSWVMMLAIFPFVGHIFYATFGQRYKGRKSIEEYHKLDSLKYETNNKSGLSIVPRDSKPLFVKQAALTRRDIYKASIELFSQGNDAYESLFKDMKKAKNFLHINYYIIKPGQIYEEFKSILVDRLNNGVKIRLIVDDFGRWAMPWYEIKDLEKLGIEVQIFGRVHFPFIGSHNGYRSHRKMVIIDGHIVHTGGINISDEYASLDKYYGRWVDYNTRITGEAVRTFSLLFIEDWFFLAEERLETDKYLKEGKGGSSSLLLIDDSPEIDIPLMQDSLTQMILAADKIIKITSPYFIPTPEIFAALRSAALSGVQVEIFIPGKADKKTVLIASRYYAGKLQELGAKIYIVDDMLIHSKIGLFDNEFAYFGTSNLDTRSLYSQWEFINLVSGEIVPKIDKLFEEYHNLSRLANDKELVSRPLKKKILRFYVNLFSPIM